MLLNNLSDTIEEETDPTTKIVSLKMETMESTMLWNWLVIMILLKLLTGLLKLLLELDGEIMDKCTSKNIVKDQEFVISKLVLDSLLLLNEYI